MSRLAALALPLLLGLATTSVLAQQPSAAPVRVTTTAVSRVLLFRIMPGQGAAHNADVLDHLIPTYEEYKKAGIIVDYNVFGKTTLEDAEDWNFGVVLTYANFGALDNLAVRTDPVTLKHYGSAAARTAANDARLKIRTLVSSFLTQAQSYSR